MNRDMQSQTNQLKCIVAMLLALADLADRACHVPHPVRWFVLRLLRPAEGAARSFVVALAGGPENMHGPMASSLVRTGNDPADAARLAACFRALAVALGNLLVQIRPAFPWRSGRDAASAHEKARRVRLASNCLASSREAGRGYRPPPMRGIAVAQRCDTS